MTPEFEMKKRDCWHTPLPSFFSQLRHPRSALSTSSRAPHDCRRVVASEKVAHRQFDSIDRIPNRPSAKFSGWNASRAARSARSRPARVSFERLKGVEAHPARSKTAPPRHRCRPSPRPELGASRANSFRERTRSTPSRVHPRARRIANGSPRERGGKIARRCFLRSLSSRRWELSPCTRRWRRRTSPISPLRPPNRPTWTARSTGAFLTLSTAIRARHGVLLWA